VSALLERRVLAATAAALGLLAAVEGVSSRTPAPATTRPSLEVAAMAGVAEREADQVTARELAEWIRSGRPGLRVLDARSDSAFDVYHIPSAERMPASGAAPSMPAANETLVLYEDEGAPDSQTLARLRARGHERVYVLRGGLLGWMTDVMRPVVAGDSAVHVAALSRYFGGMPRAATEDDEGATVRTPKRASSRASSGKASRAPSVVDDLVRRGC
jgi:rhodanese-related sulfurtransferase